MKITLENTSKIVEFNGVPARVWEGKTESGVTVVAFITRVAVPDTEDCTQFDRELQATRQPSALVNAFPARMIL